MSFGKFKTNSYCVGQKRYSDTKSIVCEITFIKSTGKVIKLLAGKCVYCDRKNH